MKWSRLITADEYGKVDINKAYPGLIKEVTAYAYTTYDSAAERGVQLRLGCKNAWKIWVNGKLIFGRDEYHRGTRIDHYQLNANFKKGQNSILIKLCQDHQTQPWTKEWEFQMRVCDPTGTALLAINRPATPTEGTNNSAPAPKRAKVGDEEGMDLEMELDAIADADEQIEAMMDAGVAMSSAPRGPAKPDANSD